MTRGSCPVSDCLRTKLFLPQIVVNVNKTFPKKTNIDLERKKQWTYRNCHTVVEALVSAVAHGADLE